MSKKYNPQDVAVLVNGKPITGFELDSEGWSEVANALDSVLKNTGEQGVVECGSWDEDQPSLINMLKEFVSTYDRQPNEMEERFLVEQFKAEFNHWSKNV